MKKTKLPLFLLLVLFSSALIPTAYADDEGNFDLAAVPQALADRLNISLFASQTLIAVIFLCMTMFPTLLLTRHPIAHVVMGIATVSFLVTIGWIPTWILLMLVLTVVVLLSGKMRGWVGGGGEE